MNTLIIKVMVLICTLHMPVANAFNNLLLGSHKSTEVAQSNSVSPLNVQPPVHGVIIQALSRGYGVPDTARNSLENIELQALEWQLDAKVVSIRNTIIGLEGEQQLCITFTDSTEAVNAHKALKELYGVVDLLNITLGIC